MSTEKFIITNGTLYLLSSAPLQLTDDADLARRFSTHRGAQNIINTRPDILLDGGYEVETITEVEEPDVHQVLVQNAQFQIDLQKAKAEVKKWRARAECLIKKCDQLDKENEALKGKYHTLKSRILEEGYGGRDAFDPTFVLAHFDESWNKIRYYCDEGDPFNKSCAVRFNTPEEARAFRSTRDLCDRWKVRRIYL